MISDKGYVMNKEFVNDCESSVAVSFSGISKLVIKRLLLLSVGGLVLWSVGTYPEVHGCTSWMVFSDLTKNNTNILHKNRDSVTRKVMVALSSDSSPCRWVAQWSAGAAAGMNASGLAAVMNAGEICVDPPNVKGKKTTQNILRVILESCDSAAQAVEKLREIIAAGNYYHGKSGSIFLFMDSKEGFVCEITAKVCSVQRYDSGYAVRSSNWRNHDMNKYIRSDIKRYLKASVREYDAISGLNRLIDETGQISVSGIFDLSRQVKGQAISPIKRSVCGMSTNSTATFEIDKQYPGVLSTAYLTVGPPRHTVYIPIPICVSRIPSAMKSLKWSSAAFKRLDKLQLDAPIPEEWTKFEKKSMEQYAAAKVEARKLLEQNKHDEAVKLLNSTAADIWKRASVLLKIY